MKKLFQNLTFFKKNKREADGNNDVLPKHGEYVVVELNNITKEYIKGKKAVCDVSFEIKKGEIVGFLGPNGAGKSTVMNIITGYIPASAGDVFINGEKFDGVAPKIKGMIGYLPETPPLYLNMTVLEYLNFVYDLKKIKLDKKEHIDTIIKKVKIGNVKGRLIKNLSKGYKQRVGLAGALIGEPEIIILDEPTVGLDPKQIIEIRDLIKGLAKERTVIVSSHIMQEIESVATKIIVINQGKIVACDTTKKIINKKAKDNKTLLTVEINGDVDKVIEKIKKIKEVESIEKQKEHGRLEDVFLALTEEK